MPFSIKTARMISMIPGRTPFAEHVALGLKLLVKQLIALAMAD